jgi:NADH-quinone oxidoreductase subunit A
MISGSPAHFAGDFFYNICWQNNPMKSDPAVLLLSGNGMLSMTSFLLQATNLVSKTNSAGDYIPIAIQLLFAGAFVFLVLGVTHLLGPKRHTEEKLQNFESGIESVGNARQPMAIKYFLIAILFVLFDVEVIFFYPYAVNFRELGWDGFAEVLLFVFFFLTGFIYIIKKGALQWED